MDFKLDNASGDLDLTNGLSTISGGQQRRQQLKTELAINLGEWFFDIDQGVPYINTGQSGIEDSTVFILSDNIPNKERYIKNLLDSHILSFEWITDLSGSSYDYDPYTREYSYSYSVKTSDDYEYTDSIENVIT